MELRQVLKTESRGSTDRKPLYTFSWQGEVLSLASTCDDIFIGAPEWQANSDAEAPFLRIRRLAERNRAEVLVNTRYPDGRRHKTFTEITSLAGLAVELLSETEPVTQLLQEWTPKADMSSNTRAYQRACSLLSDPFFADSLFDEERKLNFSYLYNCRLRLGENVIPYYDWVAGENDPAAFAPFMTPTSQMAVTLGFDTLHSFTTQTETRSYGTVPVHYTVLEKVQ